MILRAVKWYPRARFEPPESVHYALVGLTASTGQSACIKISWALEPRMSLPTRDRRRSPITMRSAPTSLATLTMSSAGRLPLAKFRTSCSIPSSSVPCRYAPIPIVRETSLCALVVSTFARVDDDKASAVLAHLFDAALEGGLALRAPYEARDNNHNRTNLFAITTATKPRVDLPMHHNSPHEGRQPVCSAASLRTHQRRR